MRRNNFLAIVLFGLLAFLSVAINRTKAAPANFNKSLITAGLNLPTDFAFRPDGAVLITEQNGKVDIFKNNQLSTTPAITINVGTGGDRGLMSIALDPNFSANHFVYFLYTSSALHQRISRFTMTGNIIDPASEKILLENPTQWSGFLNAGALRFSPSGKLFASFGSNGAGAGAMDLSNLEGKLVRINSDGTIPADNPFFNTAGAQKAIYSYGFRNPWRFNFDAAGNPIVGDVGQSSFEKIVRATSGANFGWPTFEGDCTPNCNGVTPPLMVLAHNGQGMAINGGPVNTNSGFPAQYNNNYFFGDYVQGYIKNFSFDSNGNAGALQTFDTGDGALSNLAFGPDGCLWYMTIFPGELHKICFGGTQTVTAKASANPTSGALPLTVAFSSAGSTGANLTYAWNFGDGATSTDPNPSHTFNAKGTYNVALTVSDGTSTATNNVTISAGFTAPTVTITAPVQGSKYNGGSVINFSATANDPQDGNLPSSAFTWSVIPHHNTHIHTPTEFNNTASGSFTIPVDGEPGADTSYEFKVTATDSAGLSSTASNTIFPNLSNITLGSNPTGLEVLLDGQPFTAPHTELNVVGMHRTIGVNSPQTLNGNGYAFTGWSDNGAQSHQISIPSADTTFTAAFNNSGAPPPPSCATPATAAFSACYYNDQTLTNLVLTRTGPAINFDFGAGSPDPKVPSDHFSARWQGSFNFDAATYSFTATCDDGCRVFVDNALILDKWIDQPATTYNFSQNLTAGSHLIKMEYYENGGNSVAKLSWAKAGAPPPNTVYTDKVTLNKNTFAPNEPVNLTTVVHTTTPGANQILDTEIYNTAGTKVLQNFVPLNWDANGDFGSPWNFNAPSAQDSYVIKVGIFANDWSKIFYWDGTANSFQVNNATPPPPPPPPPSCATSGTAAFTGCYYNDQNLTNLVLTRTDPAINFDFGAGSPDPKVPSDHFSARWQGNFNFDAATYNFTAICDDGCRVFVDNALVLDKWIDQPATTYNFSQNLTAGNHLVKMEYYENGGNSVAKLSWAKANTPPPPPPPPSNAAFVVSASAPNNDFTPGAATTITTNITATQDTPNVNVDTEIYNSSGVSVGQNVVQTNLVANNQFTSNWNVNVPNTNGTYTVKVGVFSSDWSKLYFWKNNAFQFSVGGAPGGPVPGQTYDINILQPQDNSTVSGLVEIRAVINGLDINTYNIGWRTGASGQYFTLDTEPVSQNYKHAWIDFSTWNWNANNRYNIQFQATNTSNAEIGNKNIFVNVAH